MARIASQRQVLPFSYLCSTSIATQAFRVFDCEYYMSDSATGATRAYLTSDLRVQCNEVSCS